jgi:hypothetical protein
MNQVDFDDKGDPDDVVRQLTQTQAELREIQAEISAIDEAFGLPEAEGTVELVSSAAVALGALSGAATSGEDGGAPALQAVTALTAAQLQLESADLQINVLGSPKSLEERIDEEVLEAVYERAAMRVHLRPSLKGVIGKLKAALAKAWHLVSRLVTPREWKVSGEIAGGIPMIGLAKAGIEITFG